MKPLNIIILFPFFYSSCSVLKESKQIQCKSPIILLNYSKQDTAIAGIISMAVYDTTLCVISGYVIDGSIYKPIRNAIAVLGDTLANF